MKKLNRTSELLWIMGILLVALGVSICSKANLGVSMIAAPAFIITEALSGTFIWLTVGITEYLVQGLFLIILCLIIRRFNWRYLLAFGVGVLYGYVLDMFLWMLSGITFDALWLRWGMLLVGDIVIAFGVACFFRTYLPLQVYELFVAEVAKRFQFNIGKTKWTFDIILLALSLLLAVTTACYQGIGLGTLVTTAVNSPLISGAGRIVDKLFHPTPLFPKLERVLK